MHMQEMILIGDNILHNRSYLRGVERYVVPGDSEPLVLSEAVLRVQDADAVRDFFTHDREDLDTKHLQVVSNPTDEIAFNRSCPHLVSVFAYGEGLKLAYSIRSIFDKSLQLTEVCLSSTSITRELLSDLQGLIEAKRLTRLHIDGHGVTFHEPGLDWTGLFNAGRKILQVCKIGLFRMEDATVDAAVNCTALTHLDISADQMSDQQFVDLLNNNNGLRTITLVGLNNLTNRALEAVIKLGYNLTRIELGSHRFNDADFHEVSKAVFERSAHTHWVRLFNYQREVTVVRQNACDRFRRRDQPATHMLPYF